MATILHKRKSLSGSVPSAGDLTQGELAVNTADGRLYTKLHSGAVVNLPVQSLAGQTISVSTLDTTGNARVGSTLGGDTRLIVQSAGFTSATAALNLLNSGGASLMYVRSDGRVGIGTASPSEVLSVAGDIGASRANVGTSNDLAANYGSIIGGLQSKASLYGEIAHSSGGFSSTAGTAQHRILVARGLTLAGAFTVNLASPATFTKAGHSLSPGDTVQLSTTGALPSPLNTTATYYVVSAGLTNNEFRLSTTRNGSAIHTSGVQSGTHSLVPSTSLTLNGATVNTTPQLIVIPERSAWSYFIRISAYNAQNNQGAAYHAFGGLRRNLSSTVELESTNGYTYLENSFVATPALVSINADAINNALDIRVTGIAGQSTRWTAVVDIAQVSFGTP